MTSEETILNLRAERTKLIAYGLEQERAADYWMIAAAVARMERDEWKSNHDCQVALKRRLSVKYGAIMRNKPRARLRRWRKWLKRRIRPA